MCFSLSQCPTTLLHPLFKKWEEAAPFQYVLVRVVRSKVDAHKQNAVLGVVCLSIIARGQWYRSDGQNGVGRLVIFPVDRISCVSYAVSARHIFGTSEGLSSAFFRFVKRILVQETLCLLTYLVLAGRGSKGVFVDSISQENEYK
jgi:hypothetical protein